MTDATWPYWGPAGANVMEQDNGPYKISYTIRFDGPPNACGPSGCQNVWVITVSAIPTDVATATRYFGVGLQSSREWTMWRSSVSARGFTLIEAMVSLLLLVIVLTVAMSMLFQMRAFAERQQFFMLPRQTARRAADYLSYYVAGASDVNDRTSPRQSPNALITYYNLGGVPVQASFDNLTGGETGNAVSVPNVSTNFGDIGTDVLTLMSPTSPAKYFVSPPFPALGASVDLFFNFRGGCATDDATNLAAFKAATGFDGTQSSVMTLLDRGGNWIYFQIPAVGYLTDGLCSDVATWRNIHVLADTQSATLPRRRTAWPPSRTRSRS